MLRIKRVNIKGFKTFAHQTEFVFDSTMTAIVGPNGCGKSNVADAIRWCLGEQSFGLLRSKRTVDVIFSGSDRRARMGMAAVSIVLDNSAGELNIDFGEVEITRRAYRDGDNEYLLNGQRVRLQDITQLLAPSGLGNRAYAVIGQGLIDRVLSLKPEERRTLFEEAAGITGYQQKRAVALRRLEATRQNLERVHDIVAELSPQLKYLKRQAERAQERQLIEEDLKEFLHTWYGYQWHRTIDSLNEARHKSQVDQHSAHLRRDRLNAFRESIDSMRARQTTLRGRIDEHNMIIGARRQQAEEVGRRLAVFEERRRQIVARRDELEPECAQMEAERENVRSRLAGLRAEIEEVEPRYHSAEHAVERTQSRLAVQQREQKVCEQRWREVDAELRKAERQIAERRSLLEQLAARKVAAKSILIQMQAEIQVHHQDAGRKAVSLSAAESDAAVHDTQLQGNQEQIAAHADSVAALEIDLDKAEKARQNTEREVVRMQARLELLQRIRSEGTGYASGVRSVLQAAQKGELSGIIGTVASQLDVPARLERAIEVALGGALQNLIARRWGDAQNAIEFLRRAQGGRATFLPLDRLRSGGPIPAPQREGILGNAADLVRYDDAVAEAAKQLLQRVWIADNLTAARRALDGHTRDFTGTERTRAERDRRPSAPQPAIVTLEGEIIRPGGAVTGGNDGNKQPGSMLAREREARALPAELANVRTELRQATDMAQSVREHILKERGALITLEEQRKMILHEAQLRQTALEQARLGAAQARQTAEWHAQLLDQSQQSLAELSQQEQTLRKDLEEAIESRQAAQEQAGLAEVAVAKARPDELLRRLADLRAAAAAAKGDLNNRRTLIEEQRRMLEQDDSQYRSKSQRLQNLQEEAERLLGEMNSLSGGENKLRRELSELQREMAPWQSQLQLLGEEQAQEETEERSMQQLLVKNEAALNASRLGLQRAEDRLENLRREIRQDFGLAEMEEAEGLAYQPPLPWQTLVAQLPVVQQLPLGLKDEVREARNRLRRLNNVNPEAPKEYEQAAERFHFLETQSDDLERAAHDLRQIIRELDTRMESALLRTFDAVASEFVHFFKLLLRGGSAQLSITDPADILNTGIEILARPPGKRPQNLDLLSGGERSLTACALVFAILRVSPTPFCVLDEVDATLDEANVDRLRVALDSLSGQTQFILITHNRRTLEGANSIYGITMGDDGVSRVISLQLEGDEMKEVSDGTLKPVAAIAL